MGKKQRQFSAEFKARVSLKTIKEKTISQIRVSGTSDTSNKLEKTGIE